MATLNPVSNIATMGQMPKAPWGNDDRLAEEYAQDPKAFMLQRCALWMDNVEWMRAWVVAATYYLPAFETLPGGQKWHRAQSTQDEALWQGKVGLVIGIGPLAFVEDERLKFGGQSVEIGDWVQYDIHYGHQFTINQIHCRLLKDVDIIAKLKDPKLVY